MEVTMSMISYGELLIAPPAGRMGIIIYDDRPQCEVGDLLEFIIFKEVVFRGTVTALERPGRCIRNDVKQKEIHKWKLHWIPIGFDDDIKKLFDRIQRKLKHGKSKSSSRR